VRRRDELVRTDAIVMVESSFYEGAVGLARVVPSLLVVLRALLFVMARGENVPAGCSASGRCNHQVVSSGCRPVGNIAAKAAGGR